MALLDIKNTDLYIRDGALNYLSAAVGDGYITYTSSRPIQLKKNRGKLASVREDNEDGMEVSFQFLWTFLTSSGIEPPTVEDALYRQNAASAWQSATLDPNAPYSVHLQLVWRQSCRQPNGSVVIAGEVYTFPEFNQNSLTYSPRDATIDCKGICNAKRPIVNRINT